MTTQPQGGAIPEWTLGDRLRKARNTTGLNTAQFAELIGVSQKSVNNAESDKHEVRKIVLNAWAMATGIAIEWLEHGTGSSAPQPPPDGGQRDAMARLTQTKRDRARSTRDQGATGRYFRPSVLTTAA